MHLPDWFLFFSLFLPRCCLLVLWLNNWTFPIPQPMAGVLWLLLPRLLILFMIYVTIGAHGWFCAHLILAIGACLGVGSTKSSS